MPVTPVSLTFDIADLLGVDYPARNRTKVWISTNIDGDVIVDADGNQIRLGTAYAMVGDDGTGAFDSLIPTNAATNPTGFQYRVQVDYPPRTPSNGHVRWDSGWFSLTVSTDLADVVAEQFLPPTYLTQVTQQLDTYVDSAQASATSSAASATSAAASASVARSVAEIDTPDALVAAIVEDDASATKVALAADFASKATQATVESGRLSESGLSASFAPLGNIDFSSATTILDWSGHGSASLIHLVAGPTFAGPYLLGIGVDHDNQVGITVSIKGDGSTGFGFNLETTSGPDSFGILGGHFGPGKLVELRKGGNAEATGPLVSLRNDYAINNGNLIEWGTAPDELKGYIDASGALVVQNADATALPHLMRVAPSGAGTNLAMDVYTTADALYWCNGLITYSNHMALTQANGAANLGAETMNTMIEFVNGNQIGFFGATPVTKPTGVAVTAAGIHAALVALGLIAA